MADAGCEKPSGNNWKPSAIPTFTNAGNAIA
jgi:hypothetical protein